MINNKEILEKARPVIERLAKLRSSNGAFAYYESEDVYQEIWCMCLEALDRYDPEIGPIENYLVTHVTNRLKNLKRDRYFRPGSDMSTSGLALTRMNLVNALPLDNGEISEQGVLLCGTPINADPVQYILCSETLAYIRSHLSDHLLEIFEDMLGNNKVRSPLVSMIRQRIDEILTERDNDVGN